MTPPPGFLLIPCILFFLYNLLPLPYRFTSPHPLCCPCPPTIWSCYFLSLQILKSSQNLQSPNIGKVVYRMHHHINMVQWTGHVVTISQEEQGEYTEKIFLTKQEKCSSRAAQQHRMERHIMNLILEGDMWEVGEGVLSWWWAGWGVDRANVCCKSPPCYVVMPVKNVKCQKWGLSKIRLINQVR